MSDHRDPDEESSKQNRIWAERPVWRGLINGVMLVLLLLWVQDAGFLGEARPVTQDDVIRAVVYGIVFGLAMFAYTAWRNNRQDQARERAEEARRKAAEQDSDDAEGGKS